MGLQEALGRLSEGKGMKTDGKETKRVKREGKEG